MLTAAAACGQRWDSAAGRCLGDSAWRADVKTATLTRDGVEMEPPVLTFNRMGQTEEGLVLQFDVLADEGENLRYTIAHCDRHWRRDALEPYEFMTGFESAPIENIEFSFATLRPYVHYSQRLPSRGAAFTHSGNYILYVTTDDGSDTLLSRRFWVSEGSVETEATVARPFDGVGIRERQEVDVSLSGAGARPEYEHVLLQQNGRQDNARWLAYSGSDGCCKRAYRYRQENIFDGGNTFRFFDCSNLHAPMYNIVRVEDYGGEKFAIVRPEEDRSRKHYLSERTLPGGMKVSVSDRSNKAVEADYVWVNLSLPMAQPWLDREVYVVGQLTDWRLDSTSRMDYKPEYRAYTKRLLLKQGYYSYQLLTVGRAIEQSATATLEGDHTETPNVYTVYVYLREPSDRADRLVDVKRVAAGR